MSKQRQKQRHLLQIKVRSLKLPAQGHYKMRIQTNQSLPAYSYSKSFIKIQQSDYFKTQNLHNQQQLNQFNSNINHQHQHQHDDHHLNVNFSNQNNQIHSERISLKFKPKSHIYFKNQIQTNRIEFTKSIQLQRNNNHNSQEKQRQNLQQSDINPKSFQRFCTQIRYANVNKALKWKNNKAIFVKNKEGEYYQKKKESALRPQIAMPIHSRKNVLYSRSLSINSPDKKNSQVLKSSYNPGSTSNNFRQINKIPVLKKAQQQFNFLRRKIKQQQRKRFKIISTKQLNQHNDLQKKIMNMSNSSNYRPWSGVKQSSHELHF